MKNPSVKSILSYADQHQRLILKRLLSLGFKLTMLDETDVVVAKKSGASLFFIDEYTPLIPHNIGLILTNRYLINSLLNFYDIKTSSDQESSWPHELRVFIDSRGFINVLSTRASSVRRKTIPVVKDITPTIHPSLYELATKVLACFSGLHEVSFAIKLNDPAMAIGEAYVINTVYPTAGPHYPFTAISGQKKEKVIDLTIDHILDATE